jgi:hypothetical protein
MAESWASGVCGALDVGEKLVGGVVSGGAVLGLMGGVVGLGIVVRFVHEWMRKQPL